MTKIVPDTERIPYCRTCTASMLKKKERSDSPTTSSRPNLTKVESKWTNKTPAEETTSSSSHEKWLLNRKIGASIKKHVDKKEEEEEVTNDNTTSPVNSSILSSSVGGVVSKGDDSCNKLQEHSKNQDITRNDNNKTTNKLGFSESSSLKFLETCGDDPSFFCKCRNTSYTYSVPQLDMNKNNNCNVRSYETAPNLSTNLCNKRSGIQVCRKHHEKSEVNIDSLSSSLQLESDTDTCSTNKNRGKCVMFRNESDICEDSSIIPSREIVKPSRRMSFRKEKSKGRTEGKHEHRKSNQASYRIKSSKKRFSGLSKLKELIKKKRNVITGVLSDSSVFSRPSKKQKSSHRKRNPAPFYTNNGYRYDEDGSPVSKHQLDQNNCTRIPSMLSGNTLPELFAARVKHSTKGGPMRFVFDAVMGGPPNVPHYSHDCKDFHKQKKHKDIVYKKPPVKNKLKGSTDVVKDKDHGNEPFLKNGGGQIFKKPKVKSSKHTNLNNDTDFKYNYLLKPQPPLPERIEVYYFDHGCSGYLRTTDKTPTARTSTIVENVESNATKFWAEVFGVFHITTTFGIIFFTQFLRFILSSLVRPLIIGTVQVSSDYCFKPFLAITFNAILQPILILIYNVLSSIKDICELIAKSIGFFFKEAATVLHAIRLVEIKNSTKNGTFVTPEQRTV